MKTKAVLDKYVRTIQGLLDCSTVEFQVSSVETNHKWQTIGEISETKKYELDWLLGSYRIIVDGAVAGSWKLYQLPHCCAICISCNAFVDPAFRGKRLGSTLNSLRQEITRLLGYSLLMCTDVKTNVNQRKLLATQGWKDIYEVYNKRTTNNVIISVINI